MALVWLFVVLLFVVGLAGIAIPMLPGIGLVFSGILLYAVSTDFIGVTGQAVGIFALVTLLAWLAEYAGGMLGAKLGGGRPLTIVGAVIGAVVGILFTPLGLLIGSFVGALVGALIELPRQDQAIKAAALAVVGVIATKVLQFVVAIGMIITFFTLALT